MITMPRPLGTLAFVLAWFIPWRPAFGVRAGASNLTFYVHHRDTIGRHIAKYGSHEPLLTRWLSDYLATARPGIFVDVGANLGWHALHAAQHQTVAAVVAFEPDPFNAWLLDRNLSANGIDKVVVASAVGRKPASHGCSATRVQTSAVIRSLRTMVLVQEPSRSPTSTARWPGCNSAASGSQLSRSTSKAMSPP